MQLRNVRDDVTKRISEVGKNLVHIEKVPHEDTEALLDVQKRLKHVSDVLLHFHSAIRELRENPFELLSCLADMHEEKKDVAFFHPDMHPPAIRRTFSKFLLKQAAFVRNPASAVVNDDTVQPTAEAGREAGMPRHPETCDARILLSASRTG